MTDLQHHYRRSPRRSSPASLDKLILARAEQQAARHAKKRIGSGLPGWLPVAVSATVACLCLVLVLRPEFDHTEPYTPKASADNQPASPEPAVDLLAPSEESDISLKDVERVDAQLQGPSHADRSTNNSDDSITSSDSAALETQSITAGAQTGPAIVLSEEASAKSDALRARLQSDRRMAAMAELSADSSATATARQATHGASDDSDSAAESTLRPAIKPNKPDDGVAEDRLRQSADRAARSQRRMRVESPVEFNSPLSANSLSDSAETKQSKPVSADSFSTFLSENTPDSSSGLSASIRSGVAVNINDELAANAGASTKKRADRTLAWLQTLPVDHFVLQLSIGRQLTALHDEMQLAGFELTEIYFWPIDLRDDRGYATLYGSFASDTAAYNRASQIERQGRFKPWVRKVADVLGER